MRDLKILGELAKVEDELIQDSNDERNSSDALDLNDKKDVQILENIAKVENGIIQVDKANKTTEHQSRKIKPQGRSIPSFSHPLLR